MKNLKLRTILVGLTLLIYAIPSEVSANYPIFTARYTADPASLVYNGRVYLYCSHDLDGQNGYKMNQITCISSSDMVNWTDHGIVFSVPRDCSWATYAWAPAVVEKNGEFWMYFGNGAAGIGVAKSSTPTGTFKDARGSVLVTQSQADVSWAFDPSVFIDDDGQAYLYFGGGSSGDNARVVKLNDNMTSLSGSIIKINAPNFFEAAWVHKYNGTYYFSYSSTPSTGFTISYMTSNDPLSGWVHRGVAAPNPPDNRGNNNHAAIFEFKGNWYMAYHNRKLAIDRGLSDPTYQRSVGVDRLYYNNDGTIQQVIHTQDGITGGEDGDSDYYNITSRISGKCVDIEANSGSDNANVIQWSCGNGSNQQFSLEDAGSGYVYIKARNSGKCLRAVNGNIIQYTCNNGWWSQMFERQDVGDGYFLIKNRSTGTCLRVDGSSGSNGASIVLFDCNNGYWSEMFSFSGVSGALASSNETALLVGEEDRMFSYPNPVTGEFHIYFPENFRKNVSIVVYNSAGVKMFTESNVHTINYHVNTGIFPSGIYLISIYNGRERITQRFSKQ